jgi:hypothetical protein
MPLIHQGDAPTPCSPDEQGRLSEDEQRAIYTAYQAIDGGVERDLIYSYIGI